MNEPNLAEYRIFIASPGGLEEIREAFHKELEHYNQVDGQRRGVLFTPVGWEGTLGGPRRAHSLINEELKTCDAFVFNVERDLALKRHLRI